METRKGNDEKVLGIEEKPQIVSKVVSSALLLYSEFRIPFETFYNNFKFLQL